MGNDEVVLPPPVPECTLIAPICGRCRREIDKDGAGRWWHVAQMPLTDHKGISLAIVTDRVREVCERVGIGVEPQTGPCTHGFTSTHPLEPVQGQAIWCDGKPGER